MSTSSLHADQPLAGLAILLVEDDEDGRKVLEVILRHAGARVTTASTASEGFELYKAAPPAVLVTDIAMPGADGIWLLHAVRSEPGLPRVPSHSYYGARDADGPGEASCCRL